MTPTTPEPKLLHTVIDDRITPAQRELLRDIGQFAAKARVTTYAVGGCVRDWLLARPVAEIDVAVEGDSLVLARRLAAAHKGTVTEHPQFGTAVVEFTVGKQTQRVDFAACRKESYAASAAYPKVTPGSLKDDLFRRDFTINAMAMRLSATTFGRLIDVFGGLRDLEARLLRVLHARSFVDDPSRILRAIRFAERLRFEIEPQTAQWMRAALHDNALSRLNRGRLRKELLAMLEEPEPLNCLRALGQWLLGARLR